MIRLDLYWMLLGMILTVIGFSGIQLGLLAEHSNTEELKLVPSITARLTQAVTFIRGFLGSSVLAIAGLIPTTALAVSWVQHNYQLGDISYSTLFGLLLLLLSFQLFGFTLMLQISKRKSLNMNVEISIPSEEQILR
jgi:hypothetical protein